MENQSIDDIPAWRREQRKRLLALREAVDATTLDHWRRAMDLHVLRGFPGLRGKRVAICWPYRNEYDARHVAAALRDAGSTILLPVIVARDTPLVFKEWNAATEMQRGPLGILYPKNTLERRPEVVLLPMLGFDAQGYRLGYGGGYFDRTLAALTALDARPGVIGVAHELARMKTIHPQPYDQAVDYLVTERGIYRRAGTLEFLGAPEPGANAALNSPVCFAAGEDETRA